MSTSVDIEYFKRWKVDRLKDYLRKRDLKVSMKKEELVALVFAAHEQGTPVVQSAEEEKREKAAAYCELRSFGDVTIPDPFFDLTCGWLGEQNGMVHWPPTMHVDIATFILAHVEDQNLSKRLLSDYKEGKAYSYFDSAWLKEVFYHPIDDGSKYCVLRSESTPSERLHHIPHKIWVAIEKKSGTVMSAYCTCFAG